MVFPTEDGLAVAVGVDVGGVEEVAAGFHADVDEVGGFGVLGGAPGFEEFVGAAEGSGAEAELGDFEAGAAEGAVVHGESPGWGWCESCKFYVVSRGWCPRATTRLVKMIGYEVGASHFELTT